MFVSKARLNTHIHEILSNIHVIKRIRWKKGKKIDISLWVRNTSNWINLYDIFLVADVQYKLNVFPCRALNMCFIQFPFFSSFFWKLYPIHGTQLKRRKIQKIYSSHWIKEKWNKHRVHNKFLFYLYCLSKYLLDNLYLHISVLYVGYYLYLQVPVQKVYVWSKWISR